MPGPGERLARAGTEQSRMRLQHLDHVGFPSGRDVSIFLQARRIEADERIDPHPHNSVKPRQSAPLVCSNGMPFQAATRCAGAAVVCSRSGTPAVACSSDVSASRTRTLPWPVAGAATAVATRAGLPVWETISRFLRQPLAAPVHRLAGTAPGNTSYRDTKSRRQAVV